MPEPSLRQKRKVEEDDGNHTTGDEKRFQALRAYVGNIPIDHRGVLVIEIDESRIYIRDGLPAIQTGVLWLILRRSPNN